MLMVDLGSTSARITLDEILTTGTPVVSNAVAFANFARGLRPEPALLTDKCWQAPASAAANFAFFRVFMHETLPRFYDVRHLESMGGRFSLRLPRIADFTVIAMNRRVVTLQGPPQDDTAAAIVHAEMGGDVFMAFCNELLARATETTLRALNVRKTRAAGIAASAAENVKQ